MTFLGSSKRATGLAAFVLVFALVTASASAAEPEAQSGTPTLQQVQQGLEQRDALIRELLRRVDALQHEVSAIQKKSPATGTSTTAAPQAQGQAQSSAQQQAPTPKAAKEGEEATSGPGSFTVNKEAAEHALERALVQTGGLLLPSGTAEIVPTFSYLRREIKNPGQIAVTNNGLLFATQDVFRSNQASAGATARVGLPLGSQFQITAPYDYAGTSNTVQIGGAGLSNQTSDTFGYGGTDLTLTKQVLHEGDWLPNLFASIGGHVNAGQSANLVLGTGFNQIYASLFATKRQDPLVFTTGFTYVKSFERDNYKPGDQYTPSVGFLFAVSPATSFQFSTQVTFATANRFNGISIPGSNEVAGLVQFGVLSILAPGLVVNLAAQVGVTPDAPDFGLTLSFPIRFGSGG